MAEANPLAPQTRAGLMNRLDDLMNERRAATLEYEANLKRIFEGQLPNDEVSPALEEQYGIERCISELANLDSE